MKSFKQINIKMSIVESLDRIREQLPKRGTLSASYGDAIRWLDDAFGNCAERNKQLFTENERLLHEILEAANARNRIGRLGKKKMKEMRK